MPRIGTNRRYRLDDPRPARCDKYEIYVFFMFLIVSVIDDTKRTTCKWPKQQTIAFAEWACPGCGMRATFLPPLIAAVPPRLRRHRPRADGTVSPEQCRPNSVARGGLVDRDVAGERAQMVTGRADALTECADLRSHLPIKITSSLGWRR